MNNSVHQVNFSIANVEVGQSQGVAFSYRIVNSSHKKDEVEQALSPVVGAAVGALGGVIGGGVGSTRTGRAVWKKLVEAVGDIDSKEE